MMGETDKMYGTNSVTEFVLYPDKAYLEINVKLRNPTPFPQTFLWWANPALAADEHTRSIFPPDVSAVYDHGKRDVSAFPIAAGTYYKVDYSAGVDISRYKNIPVPTSYMACASVYDFVGGYDDRLACGMLHVADHHVSPGKKQWTWGCGDFGKAWDRNLTDEDGPYIELMTGVYTDNQPDFTWLKPFEEKSFSQYFMPYKTIGTVKNATKDLMLSCEYKDGGFETGLYATSRHTDLRVCLLDGETVIEEKTLDCITPRQACVLKWSCAKRAVKIQVRNSGGTVLLSYTYTPDAASDDETPKPLEAPPLPADVEYTEELLYIGTHLEQYRHPTYRPEDYYAEGLKRDPYDARLNIAYGRLLLRRGEFSKSETYFQNALKRMTRLNSTPYDAEIFYLLGLVRFYKGELDAAYDWFRKGCWDQSQFEACSYFAAVIKSHLGDDKAALSHVDDALAVNPHNMRARGLKASLLRILGLEAELESCLKESLSLDPFDPHGKYELSLQTGDADAGPRENDACLEAARRYVEYGMYETAALLENAETPLSLYYAGYCRKKLGDGEGALACFEKAEKTDSSYCFPNTIMDRLVLEDCLADLPLAPMANYYLGILLYDQREYGKSRDCFIRTTEQRPGFPTAHRNLALYAYNKQHDADTALRQMKTAFQLDQKDARVLMELDQLQKKCNVPLHERLALLEAHEDLARSRDDLYTEYITLVNLNGGLEKALSLIQNHKFHPWEGGENYGAIYFLPF